MAEKIQARLLIEIMGRPQEHVKAALEDLMAKLGAEKGIKIIEKTIHDPRPLENSQGLFTSFSDVLVEFDNLTTYMKIIFSYMPSNIEIIKPESFELKNADLTELGNVILQRLHHYDSLVKGILNERAALLGKLKEVAPQLFEQPPQSKPESLEEAMEAKEEAIEKKEESKPEEEPKKKSKKSKAKKEE